MPEIGEVARIVHYIHKHLVGKTLAVVKAQHDENVYGKVGTSAAEFEKALTGKKVVDARQQGKYFWLVMSSPPHPLFHFGMTGWWKIRNEETAYYRPTKPEEPIWPPKFWKFTLTTAEEPKTEAAFVDSRRFARIRLIGCTAEDMRKTTPLKENGPDPVIDKDILTEEWLGEKLGSKRVPIKALLLDQANISGIGNWVGDELLYDARIHPEQYSNTLTSKQVKQLHSSLHYVCGLAVSTLSDSSKFPEEWLFKHRWGKGKKDDPKKLPNGASIKHITVGGRTSAIVPSVQKKTGPVAGDLGESEEDDGETDQDDKTGGKAKPRESTKVGGKAHREKMNKEDKTIKSDEEEKVLVASQPRGIKKKTTKSQEKVNSHEEQDAKVEPTTEVPKGKKRPAKHEDEEARQTSKTPAGTQRSMKHEDRESKPEGVISDDHKDDESKPPSKKRRVGAQSERKGKVEKQKSTTGKAAKEEAPSERRRSARVSRNGA